MCKTGCNGQENRLARHVTWNFRIETYDIIIGRAIVQAVSRWLQNAAARGSRPDLVKWDLWWAKWRWGRFSPSTSVSPANLHSNKFSIIIITRGRYNRSFSGRHVEWTKFGLHPPLCKLKKIISSRVRN
jgi:hypothetical protein